jgi:hypothetical protein
MTVVLKPPPASPILSLCRLRRLAFLLEEIAKPPGERAPEMTGIVDPTTRFDMTRVTVGQRRPDGRFGIASCDVIGLAACDPWFNEQGLSLSVIKYPGGIDTLDIGGVMLKTEWSIWPRRVSWTDPKRDLCSFFDLRIIDWMDLCDGEAYWTRCHGQRIQIPPAAVTPDMVLKKLNASIQARFDLSLAEIDTPDWRRIPA